MYLSSTSQKIVRLIPCSDVWSRSTRPLLPLLARGALRFLGHSANRIFRIQSLGKYCQCLRSVCISWSLGIGPDRRVPQAHVVDRSKDWYCCVTYLSFAKEEAVNLHQWRAVSVWSEMSVVADSSANAVPSRKRCACQAKSSSVLV